jgi:hypothetical protein
MSITLILWKAPVVDHPDDAARLLARYYERGEASAFASTPDIARVSNELRRTYDLVVYDPQGPGFYLPHPVVAGSIPRAGAGAYLKLVAMGLGATGVFVLGWWINVPVLDWILMIVGGFFLSVILFLLGILIVRPELRTR